MAQPSGTHTGHEDAGDAPPGPHPGADTTASGTPRTHKKKRSRARIAIASLNMRGFGIVRADGSSDKWQFINQIARDKRFAILALQETHLTDERIQTLNRLFAATLLVIGSPDPTNATAARGVAFAINTRMIDTAELSVEEIVPGRVSVLSLKRGGEAHGLKIANIYAPNNMQENADLWRILNNRWSQDTRSRPNVMMGDFNMVEDAIDRLPMRTDDQRATAEFRDLRVLLNVTDGWREENGMERKFTYVQAATASQSRLDRIYATDEIREKSFDWMIRDSGILTDHSMVSCAVANYRTPFIGKGRWAMPAGLLQDEVFMEWLNKTGIALQEEVGRGDRTDSRNPQTALKRFKDTVRDTARERVKQNVPKIDRRLTKLNEDLKATLSLIGQVDPDDRDGISRIAHDAAILHERISNLEATKFMYKRRAVAARNWLEGETISKYWSRLNAAPKQFDVMYELEIPQSTPTKYDNKSERMAEIAKEYFDGIQWNGRRTDQDNGEREQEIEQAIEPLDVKLDGDEAADLGRRLLPAEVELAIAESANGKAPGLDGLPMELWKECVARQKRDEKAKKSTFHVTTVLATVYNDIMAHGVASGTNFAEGWVCPIYKKKDRRQISNYRPITLLNTDYKVFTRVLASRLATYASMLIHPDQAGFVPGRQIFDHIRLSQFLIHYAEKEKVNGVIVALDQEKAYDRIDHAYLWRVLQKMNFPTTFIDTVKALYESAESVVVINGVISKKYKITRGVRQGDPLSCLLFDLAIEPLACALRKSTLRGLDIPGVAERLITALFADDTTVYLCEDDSFVELMSILLRWCEGSTAKFNEEKTEIIPVGTKEYRIRMCQTRAIGEGQAPIPDNIRIASDGDAVRLLGAWVGNHIDTSAPWIPVVQAIRKNLKRWGARNPTMYGRKHVISMEVGGRSQFLAKAQGMPKEVEQEIDKIITEFVWDGDSHPQVNKRTLFGPIDEGGLNLLDIRSRNEAIELMWLRSYLNLSPDRPRWAWLADVLLSDAAAASARNVDAAAKVNTFLQTWKVSTRVIAGLPDELRRMVKVAEKYRVQLAAQNPSEEMKKALPIWYHGGEGPGRQVANSTASACLRENHGVTTVGETMIVARRTRDRNHRDRSNCQCLDCEADRRSKGCDNPARCALAAKKAIKKLIPKWRPEDHRQKDGLSLSKSALKRNDAALKDGRQVTFNPSMTENLPLANVFRAFVGRTGDGQPSKAVRRPARPYQIQAEETTVYTDGSCTKNGTGAAVAGSGAWFGENDTRNTASKVPGPTQSNQAGEIFAVAIATAKTPPFAPLHILSDSKYVIKGLTRDLPKWEDRGWVGVTNKLLLQDVVARLRGRSAITTFQWVKGHTGCMGNENADKLAKEGVESNGSTTPLPPAQRDYLIPGLKLSAMTQKVAYRAILEDKTGRSARRRTEITTDHVLASMEASLGVRPLKGALWRAIRKQDVPRKMRDFFWKALHDALRVGRFWENIPTMTERAVCRTCGCVESVEHILIECCAGPVKEIWALAYAILEEKGIALPRPSIGLALGAPAIALHEHMECPPKGADRLTRLVITESVHLIWKLRCERVIGRQDREIPDHSKVEVQGRWLRAINQRLSTDQAITSRKFGKKALAVATVLETWRGVLHCEEDLHDNWIGKPGVLVGMPAVNYLPGVGE